MRHEARADLHLRNPELFDVPTPASPNPKRSSVPKGRWVQEPPWEPSEETVKLWFKTCIVWAGDPNEASPQASSPRSIIMLVKHLAFYPTEHICIVGLNPDSRVMGIHEAVIAGKSAAPLSPAEVLTVVLLLGASAFVLVHNHPSGNVRPSDADVLLTAKMKEAAKCVGVHLLDHVIVAPNLDSPGAMRSYSFVDVGIMP